MTIEPAQDIRSELESLGAVQIYGPRDYSLACPHEEFLRELYASIFPIPYEREVWDCDDYSMRYVVEASLALRLTRERVGHAILFCTLTIAEGFTLNSVKSSSHSTNLVKTAEGQWLFFEPQNGQITYVTKTLPPSVASLDFVLL